MLIVFFFFFGVFVPPQALNHWHRSLFPPFSVDRTKITSIKFDLHEF